MTEKLMKTMDGNEAAAYVSYALTEVATIFPITPSSPMPEHVDVWAAHGKKNLFGQPVRVMEMQAEAGAVGALHGLVEAGSLGTSYTASQGLMLMIPVMHRIAATCKPAVLHVAARSVGSHALSIFGDHSDVMGCRNTGWGMLCSGSVQEVMDLAGVAHLSAIKASLPMMHFFDGFRTSHEIQKVEVMPYEELDKLLDRDALYKFKHEALNPDHPTMRGGVNNPDIFFQNREAVNSYYDKLPDIVQDYMDKISEFTGRTYKLFNYYGAPDAEYVIVAMGSVTGAIEECIDAMTAEGQKVGYVQVHLYRPFSLKHFFAAMPKTVKRIAVLDRTKEPGAIGEPLYEDVCTAFQNSDRNPMIIAGRYGLSSKDVPPSHIKSVFVHLMSDSPKQHFTVGINDDVTNLSIPLVPMDIKTDGIISCKFWGFGSDGTVGANKNSIKIIGDNTDQYVQAYFEYDTKKSGGVTKSHLRFGNRPIRSTYYVKSADFVACHKEAYIKDYDIVGEIKDGGIFLLNCSWDQAALENHLKASVKRQIANKHIKFYTIDATKIAAEIGLGNRTNTVLQAAFFKLANIIPIDDAVKYMKEAIVNTYSAKGEKIVNMNCEAVERGVSGVVEIKVPEAWATAKDEAVEDMTKDLPDFVKRICIPSNLQKGDDLPVSEFLPYANGDYPVGSAAYEKRGIATNVPVWDVTKCVQCNQCSLVCPHAAIRPYLLDESEVKSAPEGFVTKKAVGKGLEKYEFRVQVSPLDCYSCGSCIKTCPVQALSFAPLESQTKEAANWDYAQTVSIKDTGLDKFSVKGSQFKLPYLEFSGACAGCGETPYVKLLTQLYGDRLYIATPAGCMQAWAAALPCIPWTKDKNGKGTAWTNSLFEDNGEFGFGMYLALHQQREDVKNHLEALAGLIDEGSLKAAIQKWLDSYGCHNEGETTKQISADLIAELEKAQLAGKAGEEVAYLLAHKEHIGKKTVWIVGGDGWAYDIGYGGLDHIMATTENFNVLVIDNEVYANTGGQSSKATPKGAVAQFAAAGRRTNKKDLGRIMIGYGHIYVASVSMGANPAQMLKALKEAEAYDGPSIVLAYSPCINHGLVKGMSTAQMEEKKAVECGYWPLYRYNPALEAEGKNPFSFDSKEPNGKYREFLMGETRYAALTRTFPEVADQLFTEAEAAAMKRYKFYKRLATEV